MMKQFWSKLCNRWSLQLTRLGLFLGALLALDHVLAQGEGNFDQRPGLRYRFTRLSGQASKATRRRGIVASSAASKKTHARRTDADGGFSTATSTSSVAMGMIRTSSRRRLSKRSRNLQQPSIIGYAPVHQPGTKSRQGRN